MNHAAVGAQPRVRSAQIDSVQQYLDGQPPIVVLKVFTKTVRAATIMSVVTNG